MQTVFISDPPQLIFYVFYGELRLSKSRFRSMLAFSLEKTTRDLTDFYSLFWLAVYYFKVACKVTVILIEEYCKSFSGHLDFDPSQTRLGRAFPTK